ncbi:helix-turn-helix domain-containing protein [Alicyclobacillus tolerans]|uniref:PucR family transcriptional regulator n=1 Tax=Alicyclobacillus tolerans TaxID=90970 RepID=UPI001F24AA93|nr:helix-turn-helix domain-containing protein [Alicyclobacillus tolerans]MCF8563847.1 helix-turn-helix domain-containing protein [Alicyclobacillus tolerans]
MTGETGDFAASFADQAPLDRAGGDSKTFWWGELLEAWANAVGISCRVCACDPSPASKNRSPGDWWRSGSQWLVQLDETHAASLEAVNLDGDLYIRRALTFTLRSGWQSRQPDWRQVVSSWFTELFVSHPDRLVQTMSLSQALPSGTSFEQPPGYLAWVHLSGTLQGSTEMRHELQEAVQQVVEAFLPGGWIGWGPRHDGVRTLIVYYPVGAGPVESRPASGPGEFGGHPVGGGSEVRQALRELLQNLASDAYVLGSAYVGSQVDGPDSLYQGAVTAVCTWRQQTWLQAAGKVSIFEENPLAYLLQSVPDHAARLFLELANRIDTSEPLNRGTASVDSEVLETLEGVIAANLNISEAARLLYLHRNTLIHRVEKIKVETGYDIRNFSDAFTLWLVQFLRRKLERASCP